MEANDVQRTPATRNPWLQAKRIGKYILWGLILLLVAYMGLLAFSKPPVPNAVYGKDYVNVSATRTDVSTLGVDHVLVNTRLHFGKNYVTITRVGISAGKAGSVLSTTKFSRKQVLRDNYLAHYVARRMEAQIDIASSRTVHGHLVLIATDGTHFRFNKDYSRFTVHGQSYQTGY
jgi:hypothetical protein